MLPDATMMLADVPGAMHREVRDADGTWRDAILAPETMRPQAGDYGAVQFEGGTLIVAAPFEAPNGRVAIRDAGGVIIERRVLSTAENLVFTEIAIGEEA